MKQLAATIKAVLPDVITDFNTVRLPAIEAAWGRSFKDEMLNEDQVTVEIAKNYARPLNNSFFRHIQVALPKFNEHTTNGSDYEFNGTLIEDKNSFSEGNGWVGNGFAKTPMHILKKFRVDADGRIVAAFIAIVDLSKCKSVWSAKTVNTNRSVIQFTKEDASAITVVVGSLKENRKFLKPVLAIV